MPTAHRRLRPLALALVCLGLFNVLDYFLTLRALGAGLHEANPFIRTIVDTPLFGIVKLLIVPALIHHLWRIRRDIRPIGMVFVWIALAAYTYVILHHGTLILAGVVPPLFKIPV